MQQISNNLKNPCPEPNVQANNSQLSYRGIPMTASRISLPYISNKRNITPTINNKQNPSQNPTTNPKNKNPTFTILVRQKERDLRPQEYNSLAEQRVGGVELLQSGPPWR